MEAADGDDLLVVNGDILTRDQLRRDARLPSVEPRRSDAGGPAVRGQVPCGVVDTDGEAWTKSPSSQLHQRGIYLLNSRVCRLVPAGEPYDMAQPDRPGHRGRTRDQLPPARCWLDIGQAGLRAGGLGRERGEGVAVGWSNRRVLVTGGGGFIGSHLVERLVAAGRRLARSYYVRRNAGLARSVFREG